MESMPVSACHECDLLIATGVTREGTRPACPRCLTPLAAGKPDTVNRTLAAIIAGLAFFWPANFLPLLRMQIAGIETTHTMIGAVEVLSTGGMPVVGLMVFFCSILAPFLQFFLLLAVLLQVKIRRNLLALPRLFRLHQQLDSWAMLEVYLI